MRATTCPRFKPHLSRADHVLLPACVHTQLEISANKQGICVMLHKARHRYRYCKFRASSTTVSYFHSMSIQFPSPFPISHFSFQSLCVRKQEETKRTPSERRIFLGRSRTRCLDLVVDERTRDDASPRLSAVRGIVRTAYLQVWFLHSFLASFFPVDLFS